MNFDSKKFGIGLCLAGLLGATSVQANSITPITLTFDENGNTTGNFGGATIIHGQVSDSLSAVNGTIPSGGGATTLDYLFPIDPSPPYSNTHFYWGWLAIYDPNGALSDLIHFDNSHGITVNGVTTTYDSLFFYSSDHDGDLADNWVSSGTLTAILASPNLVKLTEGANGITDYTPSSSSSPGEFLDSNGSPVTQQYTFEFISDAPDVASTMPLLGSAFAALLLFGRRLRK